MTFWTKLASAVGLLGLLANGSLAGAPVPADLGPLDHNSASLSVEGPNGAKVYSPADLEGLETYQLTTTTPCRDVAVTFEGILLTDLLKRHGLDELPAIVITAENDFEVTFTREAWEATPMMIATRVDGKPHRRRERGPIQFVMDMGDYEDMDVLREHHWVWMAASIRPAD